VFASPTIHKEKDMQCRVLGADVYYEEAGAGRPLLMLHGWPLDHRHMAHDFEPIFAARGGWRRLYPDLPGMGRTPGPAWVTCQDQVLDIVCAFIETVAPGERFVVAGGSDGGYLARGLVHRCGAAIDGLLLNVPAIEADSSKCDLPGPFVVHPDAEFLTALGPDNQDLREVVVAQSVELLEEIEAVFSPAGEIADFAFLDRLRQQYAFSYAVDSLPAPFWGQALFMTGRQDIWCGYREAYQILDNYPRATYVVLDRAGHVLALEQRTLFRALVNEWLDRVEEYARG
jgi:pimeloyl-ACP methyl ester carboxylesterase